MQIRELEREIRTDWSSGGRARSRSPIRSGRGPARREILAATRDLVDFVRHRDLLAALQLGIIPTLAPYFCRGCCRACRRNIRSCGSKCARRRPSCCLEELARGELDAVMLALPVEGADVETLALFGDAFLLAVPARMRCRRARGSIRGRRSAPADFIGGRPLPARPGVGLLRGARLAASSRDVPAGLGATSLATVMQMVANGYGVTLLPEVAVDAEGATPG